jgi:predicted ester cyclase
MSIAYYKSIDVNDHGLILEHPDNGDKDEFFEISLLEFSHEKIDQTFEFYIDKILNPYLENLKW